MQYRVMTKECPIITRTSRSIWACYTLFERGKKGLSGDSLLVHHGHCVDELDHVKVVPLGDEVFDFDLALLGGGEAKKSKNDIESSLFIGLLIAPFYLLIPPCICSPGSR